MLVFTPAVCDSRALAKTLEHMFVTDYSLYCNLCPSSIGKYDTGLNPALLKVGARLVASGHTLRRTTPPSALLKCKPSLTGTALGTALIPKQVK